MVFAMSPADRGLGVRLLDLLRSHPRHALFVTELPARQGGPAPSELDDALGALDGDRVRVVDHTSPDPHLAGDLRVVALVGAPATDPVANAELVWTAWLRDVLAAHRCC